MNRLVFRTVTCLALVALAITPASAQRGGRGRGGFGGGFGRGPTFMLGFSEQLQKELKITDEQKEKIRTVLEDSRNQGGGFESFRGFRDLPKEEQDKRREEMRKRGEETRKKIEAVLNAEQNQRLKGITLQLGGVSALTNPDVVAELKLSDEQVKQLKTIAEETSKKSRELREAMGRDATDEERTKAREKTTQLQKDANEEALAVLNAEQKTQLEKLKGPKFELDMSQFRGFGRGGFGGRRRGGDGARKTEEKKSE